MMINNCSTKSWIYVSLAAFLLTGCDGEPVVESAEEQASETVAVVKPQEPVETSVPVESVSTSESEAAAEATETTEAFSVGDEWKLVWADEFEGDKLNLDNWTRQILADPFNEEWQQYFDYEENSYVEDGCLVIKAIHTGDEHADNQYTSARLHTGNKHAWKYGKIAARIQLPSGKGIWPAFWMLGADINEIGGSTPWPKCGEIDILELWGSRDNAVVECNIHYDDDGHKMMGAEAYKLDEGIFADDFHVFEIEWDEKQIVWLVDGNAYHKTDITDPSRNEFHGEQYILLNIAVGGTYAGEPDDTTPFPSTMRVDWVRVYQQDTSSR